ncbi:nucleotidyltransferase family protein [Heyndrickxia sp. FSL W8-0423]|uniref:nucleotidyltransferase family protein n=1 Tax=Heyndrickxia sp. FSL W8-0423 TaxID=2921601 RepID=UPI0030F85D3C
MSIERFLFDIATKRHSENDLESYDRTSIINLIKNHRLIDPFLDRYPDFKMPNNNEENSIMINEGKLKEINKVISTLNRLQVDYVVLKGLAMRKYYPSHISRQSVDFDFLLKNIESFFEIYPMLKEEGYKLDYFPTFSLEKGEARGVIAVYKELKSDNPVYIEFNVGGFLISECTWLTDEGMWSRRRLFEYHSMKYYIPSDEWNLIILIAEAGGNKFNRLRDAVDYYFLTNNSTIDTGFVNSKIKEWKLHFQYKRLKKMFNQILRSSYSDPKIKFIHLIKYSFMMEIRHVIPLTLKRYGGKSFLKLYIHYIRLLGEYYYQRDKCLKFVKKLDWIIPVDLRFKNGIHVHFVPILENTSDNWKFYKENNNYFVISPVGSFLLSNYCLFEEDELEEEKEKLIVKVGD